MTEYRVYLQPNRIRPLFPTPSETPEVHPHAIPEPSDAQLEQLRAEIQMPPEEDVQDSPDVYEPVNVEFF